jgi:hypothetical protein
MVVKDNVLSALSGFLAQQANMLFSSQGYREPQEIQGRREKRETLVNLVHLETRAHQDRRVKRETKETCPMTCFHQVGSLGSLPGSVGHRSARFSDQELFCVFSLYWTSVVIYFAACSGILYM